jgi:diaminopimelate epimerase
MISFRKVHGTGNDFIVVADPAETRDWGTLAQLMCPRRTGIGADGLIVSLRSAESEYIIRCFNPDGSVATMCGNGLRCAARCAADDYADTRMVLIMEDVEHPAVVHGDLIAVTAMVGAVSTQTVDIAHSGQLLRFTSVSTGTEHAVALADDIDAIDLAYVGPAVRYHPSLAPLGTNVNVVQVLDDTTVKIRTWERGVEGETLSCGSGAVAGVVVSRLTGSLSPGLVSVLNRSGTPLEVDCPGDRPGQEAWLSGPAEVVYVGEL